jgi:hypothetical protein
MRRPTRGATTHPAMNRPGMGFGRPLRPRPAAVDVVGIGAELDAFFRGDDALVDDVIDLVNERPSVTHTDSVS